MHTSLAKSCQVTSAPSPATYCCSPTTESSRNEDTCVPFASAKFSFPPPQIILDQQFKTLDLTQKQQAHKQMALCQLCLGEQPPADRTDG